MPGAPSLNSSPWGAPSSFVQVTLSPGAIVISAGAKAKLAIETFAPSFAGLAACAIWAQTARVKKLAKRMPTKAHNSHKCFRVRLLRVVTIRLSPSGRRGLLHHDPAWRVADRDSGSSASCEIDDGDIVRALIGYIHGFTVAGRGRPVGLFPDRDAARRLVRRWVEQEQLPRPLHDYYAERRAARVINEMGRYARRNLRHDLVGRRIEHLDCTDSGLGKVEQLAVVSEFPVARCLLER